MLKLFNRFSDPNDLIIQETVGRHGYLLKIHKT